MSFRPSPILYKKLSSASRSWLSRQARDPYVKQRNTSLNAYRSRSAFKLLELDTSWGSFLSKKDIRAVVDLGAAPGGWSQVVSEKLGWINLSAPDFDDDLAYGVQPWRSLSDETNVDQFSSWSSKAGRGVIVSVDLLPMAPIPGVQTIQMDFLSPEAGGAVKAALTTPENPSGMADIILSDMAANFSGYKLRDVESSLDICHSVFEFAKDNLQVRDMSQGVIKGHRGGTLLLKHFAHPLLQDFRKRFLEPNFNAVHYIKPASSRAESAEGYWLCRGWKGLNSWS
ncbi:23S ribosomal RNA methyltransferase [Gyrodon lividus]|nr:23S ribosomal RNA methyltransferase [Gyrodon lividus]